MAKARIRRQRPAADIEAQIRSEIESITPLLGLEHCVIHLSRFTAEDGVAVLRVDAACSDCGVSAETFFAGIETRLKVRIAEVREVRMEAAE